MNEEKLYEVLNNQIQFSNDLMDLNIKYTEEIERLNKRINKVLEMLDKPYYCNLRIGALRDIQEILRGEQDEDNSTSK